MILEQLKELGVLQDAPYLDSFCFSKEPVFPYDRDLELLLCFELYAKKFRICPTIHEYENFIEILNNVDDLKNLKMKIKGDFYLFCLEFNLDYSHDSFTQYESYIKVRLQALSSDAWSENMKEDILRSRLCKKCSYYTTLEHLNIMNEKMKFVPLKEEKEH